MANLYDDPSHTGRKRMWSPTLEELQAITHTLVNCAQWPQTWDLAFVMEKVDKGT